MRRAVVAALIVTGAAAVATAFAAWRTKQKIEEIPTMSSGEVGPGAELKSGPWMSGGIPRTVTTRQGETDPTETAEQHAARHAAAFAAMLAQFPKDE